MNHSQVMRAEAATIINLLKQRNVRVNIVGGYVTPGFYVYQLRMDATQKFKMLADCAEDMQRLLYADRDRMSLIDINDPDQQVVVRITAQPLAVEINRPSIAMLTYDDVRSRSRKLQAEFVAIAGMAYASKDGQPIVWRVADSSEPHCLVAGGTGSGKSALLVTLMMSLAENTSPQRLRLVVVDGGNSTLKPLAKLAHAVGYASDPDEVLSILSSVAREVLRRKKAQQNDDRIKNRIVIVIDELANVQAIMEKPQIEKLQKAINFITGEGRKYGVHCVTCTQKPLAEVTGTLTKTNSAKRFVGAVPSKTDAVTCAGIGDTGAEVLAGKGDFITVRNSRVQRFQAAYIEDPMTLAERINRQWLGVRVEPLEPVRSKKADIADSHTSEQLEKVVQNHPEPVHEPLVEPVEPPREPVVEPPLNRAHNPFPLEEKRPLRRSEAAIVRHLAETMSKNQLCVTVYGAKSGRYMEWINDVLVPLDDSKIIKLRKTA